jgi:hypothetical protein
MAKALETGCTVAASRRSESQTATSEPALCECPTTRSSACLRRAPIGETLTICVDEQDQVHVD